MLLHSRFMDDPADEDDNEWDSINPDYIERHIRGQLPLVSLIGELELGPRDEIYLQAKSVVTRSANSGNLIKLPTSAPCSLCVFLVAEGAFNYSNGAFWDQLSIGQIQSPNHQRILGQAFLTTLSNLQMEDFSYVHEEENSLKFVTPILLHGGVPKNSAQDLWKLLLSAVNEGFDEADQILAHWRSTKTKLHSLDKPVRRFLDYGGVFASDLLQRMVDLADYVSSLDRDEVTQQEASQLSQYVGLPTYLVEQLLTNDFQTHRKQSFVRRPRISIDPYAGEGPTVEFPAVANASDKSRWILRPSASQGIFKASKYDSRTVELAPGDSWEASIEEVDTPKNWRFGGVEGLRLFFFDIRTGELLRDQSRLGGEWVLALSPVSVRYQLSLEDTSPIPEGDELPRLSGAWAGWNLRVLDLRGIKNLVASQVQFGGSETSTTISVHRVAATPRILSQPIDGIIDSSGWPVFDNPPLIQVPLDVAPIAAWNIRFTSKYGDVFERRLIDVAHVDDVFQLSDLLGDEAMTTGELIIRGPLGSDLRTNLTIVNQLTSTRPTTIVSPVQEVDVELSATSPIFPLGTLNHSLKFTDSVARQSVSLNDGLRVLVVSVSIPRILWFLRRIDSPLRTLSNQQLVIGLDDLESRYVDALIVHTGQESIAELRLMSGDTVIQKTDVVRITSDAGRWSFPLSQFTTTISQSGQNRLTFELDIDGTIVIPLSVVARFQVSDLKVDTLLDPSQGSTLIHCQWRQNKRFLDREIRIWSITRPWEGPVCRAISDDIVDEIEVLIEGHDIPAGPYFLEISVQDPWLEAERPATSTPNIRKIDIGTPYELQQHLRRLQTGGKLALIERFASAPNTGISIDELRDSLEDIEHELALTLLSLLTEKGDAFASDRIVDGILQAVSSDSRLFGRTLVEINSASTDVNVGDRFVIAALPYIELGHTALHSEEDVLTLWRASLASGAAFDHHLELGTSSVNRWAHFTGWPQGNDELPSGGGSIPPQLTEKTSAELEELALAIQVAEGLPLQWGGFFEATFEILKGASQNNGSDITQWRNRHSPLNDARIRLSDDLEHFLKCLEPHPNAPRWTIFSQDILAAAIHLLYIRDSRVRATRALWDALPIARKMVERNILLVLALREFNE
jgi:hypothetical protein